MKLLWMTDIHLDHMDFPTMAYKVSRIREEYNPDAVVLTGDNASALTIEDMLTSFQEEMGCPVNFVLGNHDYYDGSIQGVSDRVNSMQSNVLTWLDMSVPVMLSKDTALTGSGGWYDANVGKPEGPSALVMSDWYVIKDFKGLESTTLMELGYRGRIMDFARGLASADAVIGENNLRLALDSGATKVYFATHYPPYSGACWHEGGYSDARWAPWFTNITMGKMLDKIAAEYPDKHIEVLCGHTHSPGVYKRSDNLLVRTGQGRYQDLLVSGIFEV